MLDVWGESAIKCGGVWENVETDEEKDEATQPHWGQTEKALCE